MQPENPKTIEEVVSLFSRVFLVIAIAFGTALVTCLSVLPYASTMPELVDLYIMIARFSLSGLIGAFVWYIPLIGRVRIAPGGGWRSAVRAILTALSVIGAATIVTVLLRIVINGAELLSVIAARFGTMP